MMKTAASLGATLKETCQLTNAIWSALVERRENGWNLKADYRMTKARAGWMLGYITQRSVDAWLCGALAGGRTRSRKTPASCPDKIIRLYVFPIEGTQNLVLVGAAELDKQAQRIWRLLVSAGTFGSDDLMLQPADTFIFGGPTSMPYDLPRSLERVLARIVQYVPCNAGWLGIYKAAALNVEAHWNCPQALGNKLIVESNDIFSRVRRTSRGVFVQRDEPEWQLLPQQQLLENASVWVGIPLLIGQRLIGVVALWRDEAFTPAEWLKLQSFSLYAASSVEMFVTFSEMANHLRRLAMLNDFALVVSSAENLEQIVRRVFAMVARTFGTELVSLVLLSSDERILREYRSEGRTLSAQTYFIHEHPLSAFLRDGGNLRVDDTRNEESSFFEKNIRSALVVSLKYRGKVIGVLELKSRQAAAFSEYDENLLMVIASHLAGLVEYARLREEAEARARNLELIHEVIQEVINLDNVKEVAQYTADILVRHFAYELAVVLLLDHKKRLRVQGVSGAAKPMIEATLKDADKLVLEGITGEVFRSGQSVLANDVSKNAFYRATSGWDAGSELCVALQDNEQILGIIDIEASEANAFTHNDVLALESLAGFLTSLVSSVDRYQMLQDTIQALQMTQEEVQQRMEAQRAAENRLIQAAKLAAVGEMAAGIAHELNNPLTTVAGFSELVLDDLPEDSPQRNDIEMVLREARRARSVVRRLLDFARQSETVRVRSDLNEIIEDVAALTKHLFHTSAVVVEMQLGRGMPWILMDRNQIKQVVLNLMHNALHAMPSGGKVSIKTQKRKRDKKTWLVMTIADNGVGIPAEILGRIFEPFFTTKAGKGGTGLGLSVTYGIVTDHNGFIEVESEPGQGSNFQVWFPVEDEN